MARPRRNGNGNGRARGPAPRALDPSRQVIKIARSALPGNVPVGLEVGELGIDIASPPRLWVGCPTAIDASGLLALPLGSGGGITTLTGDVAASGTGSVAATVQGLQGRSIDVVAPARHQVIAWDDVASRWTPMEASALVSLSANYLPFLTGAGTSTLNGSSSAAETLTIGGNTANSSRIRFVLGAGAGLASNTRFTVGTGSDDPRTFTVRDVSIHSTVVAPSDRLSIYDTGTVRVHNSLHVDGQLSLGTAGNWQARLGPAGDFQIVDALASSVRLTIDSGGNWRSSGWYSDPGAPSYLQIYGEAAGQHAGVRMFAAGGNRTWLVRCMGTAGGTFNIHDETVGLNRLSITGDGTSNNTTGTWGVISDPRTKKDIAPWRTGLDAIRRITPITFAYNGRGGTERNGARHLGLNIDEVEPVLPELVGSLDIDGEGPFKTASPSQLVYVLVNAVKELAADLELLRNQVHGG